MHSPKSKAAGRPALRDRFHQFARATSDAMGAPMAFLGALSVVIVWGLTGPFFGFSDTWQLVINTGTTIVTFIMVFLIQSTQNRDAKAVHLKLDELLRALEPARTELVDLENLSEDELTQLADQFAKIQAQAQMGKVEAAKKAQKTVRRSPGQRSKA